MSYRTNFIDFFSARDIYQQDTTLLKTPVSADQQSLTQSDTILKNTVRQIDFSAIDSILRQSEEREKQIQQEAERQAAIQRWRQRKTDTTEILYKQFGIAGFPIKENLERDAFEHNFLYNIPNVKPEERKAEQLVFIEDQNSSSQYKAELKSQKELKPRYIAGKFQFDWITILLLASFLLLGWIRLFSKKYLLSLVKSIVSYQESNTLYREKNSLRERASFMVNLLFISNISLFFVQLKHFWNIDLGEIDDLLIYGIVFVSLIGLYIFRAFTSWFIGYVFLKQRVFAEYFHNLNIFTKNTGLFLFPIIITLQFLSFEFLPVIVYAGLVMSGILYLFQLVRSFQIIIRKNVSIYYMILYLCAFEFAPFLILYKVLTNLT